MKHFETRMKADGLLEVPLRVRDELNLKEGDRIDFYLEDENKTLRIVARNRSLSGLKGIFKHEGPPVDIDEAISETLAEKDERIKREWNEWHEFEEWRRAKNTKAAE